MEEVKSNMLFGLRGLLIYLWGEKDALWWNRIMFPNNTLLTNDSVLSGEGWLVLQ